MVEFGRKKNLHVSLEFFLIAALVVVYAASFNLTSVVNGLGKRYEIFGQDSRVIILALADQEPYKWNAQNHILYHWLMEHCYIPWKAVFGTGLNSAYYFLKSFTAATGLWFLLAVRQLLVTLEWKAHHRLLLLPLSGLILTVWFHYSAIETSGLCMPAVITFLIALIRRIRSGNDTLYNHSLLVGALVFAFLTRVDQCRYPFALTFILMLPHMRRFRRGLAIDLALFALLSLIGFSILAGSYYDIPFSQAFPKLVERQDREDLEAHFMKMSNLTPHNLWQVFRAGYVYSWIMPVHARFPFKAGLGGLFHSPLSMLTLIVFLGVTSIVAILSLRRLLSADPYIVVLLISWVTAWFFYTWFDPHEPFLWTLQFGVLQFAALVDVWPRSTRWTILLGASAVLIIAHNYAFFWLRYR